MARQPQMDLKGGYSESALYSVSRQLKPACLDHTSNERLPREPAELMTLEDDFYVGQIIIRETLLGLSIYFSNNINAYSVFFHRLKLLHDKTTRLDFSYKIMQSIPRR